jgi:anti-sigma B factor antagonist
MIMKIEQNKNGNELTIALQGRLDTATAPELEEVIRSSLDGVTELVLDLKELDYISSAGLRVLLAAQKTMNKQGAMKVQNVNETVNEIFEVTGFTDILTII